MIWAMLLGLLLALASLRRYRNLLLFGYTDLVCFLAALAEKTSAERSLYARFAHGVRPPVILGGHFLASRLRLSPLVFETGRYLLQIALGSVTVFLLARLATGSNWGGLLAVPLLLGSNFSETGWYMRIGLTYSTATGKLALVIGSLLLACFLVAAIGGSAPSWPFGAAGLLTLLHPIHGVLTGGLLFLLKAVNASPGSPFFALGDVGLFALGSVPFAAYLLWNRRGLSPRKEGALDDAQWWRWMAGRTRNMFALAGLDRRSGGGGWKTLTSPPLLVFALGGMSLYAGTLASGVSGVSGEGLSVLLRAGLVVFGAGLAGFLAQMLFSDLLRIRAAASLCLARTTTYSPFYFVAFWTVAANVALARGDLLSAAVVVLAFASLGQTVLRENSWLTFFSFVPLLLCLPSSPPLVLILGILTALLGGLGFAAIRPKEPASQAFPWPWVRRTLAFFRWNARDSRQLACLGAAACLGLLHLMPQARLLPGDWRLPVLAAAMLMGVWYVRHIWTSKNALAPAWEELQLWARNHAEPGSLFLVPPVYGGFEVRSGMPTYLDSNLFMYALYMPSLTEELRRRIRFLGVDPDNVEPMGLNRELTAAYRKLSEKDVARFAPRMNVAYIVLEKAHFHAEEWPTRRVAFANAHFVALSLAGLPAHDAGAPEELPQPRIALNEEGGRVATGSR